MNVLVDTSVWSLALRRRTQNLSGEESLAVKELRDLIQEGRARMLGIVRQELLSGIKSAQQFEKLREVLEAFPDEEITREDFVNAAKLGNACRAKGVSVSLVDILLCAAALGRGWEIFSMDPDFQRYSRVLGVRLHVARK